MSSITHQNVSFFATLFLKVESIAPSELFGSTFSKGGFSKGGIIM